MRGFPKRASTRARTLTPATALGVLALFAAVVPGAHAAGLAKITSLDPTEAYSRGGTFVVVSGTNLGEVTQATVDGTPVDSFDDEGDGTYSFYAPPHALGLTQVRLTTPDGISLDNGAADDLTYVLAPEPPEVTSVTPNFGPIGGGNKVTIKGNHLASTSGVLIGDFSLAEDLTIVSDNEITVTAPPSETGAAVKTRVFVFNPGGAAPDTPADDYYYGTPPVLPAITSVSPTSGSAGTVVTINGTGLAGTTGVKFGATSATTFTQVSATQVKATAPPGAGSVDITATTANGTSPVVAADKFNYVVVIPAPVVSSLSPTSGSVAGGNVVTINGSNLAATTGVSFGGTPGTSIVQTSSTQIQVTAPAHAAGKVDVVVTTLGAPAQANTAADDYTYVTPVPSISGLAPSTGPNTGGTVVTASGANLSNVTAVSVGGVAATAITQVSASQVKFTVPAHAAGKADVIVTTAGGTSPNTSADDFTYFVPAPTVSGISPTTGVVGGGTVVTITGTNLSGTTGVTFDGVAGTTLTNVSATQVKVTSPAHAAGKADVIVTTAGGPSANSSADDFTYFVPAPTVSAISPASGPTAGGTTVTIDGANLSGASVTFGGTAGTVTPVSASQIKVSSPAHAAGKVDVIVTTAGGASANTAADDFTYVPPTPAVTSITPTSGLTTGGTVVTINGTDLANATSVKFGSATGTSLTQVSATQVKATAPAGSGTVDVSVTTAGGTSANTAADNFTYVVPVPAITSLSPTSGSTAGGTIVTINGTDLAGTTGVKFGSTAGTGVTQVSATQVKATAPAGTGTVDVSVTTAGGTSANTAADNFTYVIPAPAVTLISPASGSITGGTVVTITGANLANATGVKFGSAAGTAFTQVSATQVKATSPAGSAGKVDVTVTTAGGTSANTTSDDFTYIDDQIKAPILSDITPTTGFASGGTVVTIDGTNLANATAVKFGTTPAASFTQVSATQIKATSPVGSVGTVAISVTTAGGTTANTGVSDFTYKADPVKFPVITAVSPVTGVPAGGTVVTITGTDLDGATGVKFGDVPATSFTQVSATSVQAVAPAGSGTVDVTVTTPLGTSNVTSSGKFTYATPGSMVPVIAKVYPNIGLANIGGLITIAGVNFKNIKSVRIGNKSTVFFALSSSKIVAFAPGQAAGVYPVTVITAYGTSTGTAYYRYISLLF